MKNWTSRQRIGVISALLLAAFGVWPWTALCAAEKVTLKVIKVDSEETSGEDGKGANAVDGDPNTFWHTQWQDANPECPHEIILALEPPAAIGGFTYLPRQDDNDHGNVKNYEFYVSQDGKEFGQ